MLSIFAQKRNSLQRAIAGGVQPLDEQLRAFAHASSLDETTMHLTTILRGLGDGLSETVLEDICAHVDSKTTQADVGQGVGERNVQLRQMINQLINGTTAKGGSEGDSGNEIPNPTADQDGSNREGPVTPTLQNSNWIAEQSREAKSSKMMPITAAKGEAKSGQAKTNIQQTVHSQSSKKTATAELAQILSRYAGGLPEAVASVGATKPIRDITAVEKVSALHTPSPKQSESLLAAQMRVNRELVELAAKAERRKPDGAEPKPADANADVLQGSLKEFKSIEFKPVVTLTQLLHRWFPDARVEVPPAEVLRNAGQGNSSQRSSQNKVFSNLPESRNPATTGQTTQTLPAKPDPLPQSLNPLADKSSTATGKLVPASQPVSSTHMQLPSGKPISAQSRPRSNVPDELVTTTKAHAITPESRETAVAGQTPEVFPSTRNPLLRNLSQLAYKSSVESGNLASASRQASTTFKQPPSEQLISEQSRPRSHIPDELVTAVQWLGEEELEQTLLGILRRQAQQRGVDLP